MSFLSLDRRLDQDSGSKLTRAYDSFEQLLRALERKSIPSNVVNVINMDIVGLNAFVGDDHQLAGELKRVEKLILKMLERDFQMVVKNHYRRSWIVVGMTLIGVPLGLLLGATLDNASYLAIGVPFGMMIGFIIGGTLDKQAKLVGRQLDFTSM